MWDSRIAVNRNEKRCVQIVDPHRFNCIETLPMPQPLALFGGIYGSDTSNSQTHTTTIAHMQKKNSNNNERLKRINQPTSTATTIQNSVYSMAFKLKGAIQNAEYFVYACAIVNANTKTKFSAMWRMNILCKSIWLCVSFGVHCYCWWAANDLRTQTNSNTPLNEW